jgi:hypothetical protein
LSSVTVELAELQQLLSCLHSFSGNSQAHAATEFQDGADNLGPMLTGDSAHKGTVNLEHIYIERM